MSLKCEQFWANYTKLSIFSGGVISQGMCAFNTSVGHTLLSNCFWPKHLNLVRISPNASTLEFYLA